MLEPFYPCATQLCTFWMYTNLHLYLHVCIYIFMCMLVFLLPILLQKNSTRESLSGQNQQSSLPSDTHTHSVGTVWMCPAYRYSLFFGSRLRKATGWRSPNWKAQETNKLSFWWVNTGRNSECENVRTAACSCIYCSLVKETDQMLFSQTYTLVSVRMQT